jgi:hypothetical protein
MSEPKPSPKPSLQLVRSQTGPQKQGSSPEPALFGAHAAEEPRSRIPLLIGFAVVLAVVALIAILGRGKNPVPRTADPYSPMLVVEKATISQADNFVGSTVTYIDLATRNSGDRTVVGGVVLAVFRDSLDQPVQTEILPLRALLPHTLGGVAEAGDLALAPLGPGQTRVLRLTVEHISSQWNQAQPELEFRGLRFK